MKERFYKSAKWLFDITVATVAWMFIFNIIDDYQYVDWGFFKMIGDGDWDGAVYCITGTACLAETFKNIAKWFTNTIKEIKG